MASRKPRRLKREWPPEVVALLGQMPDKKLAEQLNLTAATVGAARRLRQIPAFAQQEQAHPKAWTAEHVALLGTMSDADVAKKTGRRNHLSVSAARRDRGIPPFQQKTHKPWATDEIAILGTMSDSEAGKKLGRLAGTVTSARSSFGIPAFNKHRPRAVIDWSDEVISLLGKVPDTEIARQLGCTSAAVCAKRKAHGIKAKRKTRAPKPAPKMSWEAVVNLSQPDFFHELAQHYSEKTGKKLTYSVLFELSHWSVSRLQKWFTPGTATQPLKLQVRHHLWLAVVHCA